MDAIITISVQPEKYTSEQLCIRTQLLSWGFYGSFLILPAARPSAESTRHRQSAPPQLNELHLIPIVLNPTYLRLMT